MNFFIQLVISFIGSIPALFFALWVEKQRMPKLDIIATEEANADNTFRGSHPHTGERWKFFRVLVKNKPFIFPFRWIPRQTAENCRAKIEFSKIGSENFNFSMMGRWASTPEMPYIQEDAILKVFSPDPVTIIVNDKEYLDVVAKHENDKEAFGWNNEAYFNNWRTPMYKLERGKYIVKISIATQNGTTFMQRFELLVSDRIEDMILKNL